MKLKLLGTNRTEIHVISSDGYDVVFFSYDTPVAARINGMFYMTSKKWNQTTAKHIKEWLGGSPVMQSQRWFDALLDEVKVLDNG